MGNLYNLVMNVFKIGSDYYLIEPDKDYTFSINDNNKVNITKFVRNKYSNFSFMEFIVFLNEEKRPYRVDLKIDKFTDGYNYNYIYDGDKDRDIINKELVKYAKEVSWLKVTKTDYKEFKDSENCYLKSKANYILEIEKKEVLKPYYVKLYESIVKDFFSLDSVKHNQKYEIVCSGLEDYYFINRYFNIHLTKLANIKIDINNIKLEGKGDYKIFKHLVRHIDNLLENNVYKYNVEHNNVFRSHKKDFIEKYMLKQEYIESLGIDYKNYCKDRDKVINVKLI